MNKLFFQVFIISCTLTLLNKPLMAATIDSIESDSVITIDSIDYNVNDTSEVHVGDEVTITNNKGKEVGGGSQCTEITINDKTSGASLEAEC